MSFWSLKFQDVPVCLCTIAFITEDNSCGSLSILTLIRTPFQQHLSVCWFVLLCFWLQLVHCRNLFCFKGCQVYIRNLWTSFMGESTWISFRKFTWVMRFGNTGQSKSCAFVLRLGGGSSLKPNPLDWSPPGSSVHQILQARILERVTISSSRHLPNPRIEPMSCMSPKL